MLGFCHFSSWCVELQNKEKLAKSILLRILDRDSIVEQENYFIDRIIENLKNANQVLIKDMLEWKQSEKEEAILREKFFEMESQALERLRLRLKNELNLYQLILRSTLSLYMQAFSLKDLLVLRKFYATEAGKKSLRLALKAQIQYQEVINQQLVPVATRISAEVQKELVENFIIQEP